MSCRSGRRAGRGWTNGREEAGRGRAGMRRWRPTRSGEWPRCRKAHWCQGARARAEQHVQEGSSRRKEALDSCEVQTVGYCRSSPTGLWNPYSSVKPVSYVVQQEMDRRRRIYRNASKCTVNPSPAGTPENSPAIHRWVIARERKESRQGRKNYCIRDKGPLNIQHPTSNIEHPTSNAGAQCVLFGVGRASG
jgi:hypothetical protein